MKKVAIFAMTVLFAMAVSQIQAQVKHEKEQIKETKKELKTERKALRKLEGTKVSELAKTHFYADFGKVSDAVWKRVDTYDEVMFTKDGKKMKAFYDYNANLVGTTSHKKFTDLPANAQREIKKKYKDYTIGSVVFFDDNEANDTDMIMYGMQFDDADNYFVELTKANKTTILQVNRAGDISFFKDI
jgi:hypothetical protein